MIFADALVDWVPASCSMRQIFGARWLCLHTHFAASRTVFILKSPTVDDKGLIVRSPDALRPLTLCNRDCKIVTRTICFGLHRYSTRRIHPAQRCVSTRQMTDNIFEVETTALARFPCATRDSGILLTDFGCPYPCVKVEFAGKARRQILMARGVRQGCPVSEFLFTMAFDPFFPMAS